MTRNHVVGKFVTIKFCQIKKYFQNSNFNIQIFNKLNMIKVTEVLYLARVKCGNTERLQNDKIRRFIKTFDCIKSLFRFT